MQLLRPHVNAVDNCFRFNPESYKVHKKICSADKPFKPLPGFVPNPAKIQ